MKEKYLDFIQSIEESDDYWIESIISDFTDEICRLMEEKGISRTELAEKIDSSPAYITKVLRGNTNFTLASMTKLARALDTVVRVHLAPREAVVTWEDDSLIADTWVDETPSFDSAFVYTTTQGSYACVNPDAEQKFRVCINSISSSSENFSHA